MSLLLLLRIHRIYEERGLKSSLCYLCTDCGMNIRLNLKSATFCGAHGSVVVKALCYKPEVRGFENQRDELIFFNLSNHSGLTRPWVYSVSNRNEYQKYKNDILGSRVRPVRRADNLTAICEPFV
jgi:hypothetical protein